MGKLLTVCKINLMESFNSTLRFGKSGLFIIISEIITLLGLFYLHISYDVDSAFYPIIILYSLCILMGNSYLNAKKILFSQSNVAAYLQAVPSQTIVWAALVHVVIKNLRFTILFPFIILVLQGYWFGLLFLPLLILAASATAVMLSVVGKISSFLDVIFYLLSAILWAGGTIITFSQLLGYGIGSHGPSLWITAVLSILLFALFCIGQRKLAALWEICSLKSFNNVKKRHPLPLFIWLKPFCRNMLIVKEWTIALRNPINMLRLAVWFILTAICLFTPLRNYITNAKIALGVSLCIWLFSFGELIATNWQNESEKKCLYWLANVGPVKVFYTKVFSFLPLMLLSLVTTLSLIVFLALTPKIPAIILLYNIALIAAMNMVTLTISALIPVKGTGRTNDYILEQIPQSLGAIAGLTFQIIIILTYFLIPTVTAIFIFMILSLICCFLIYSQQMRTKA